MPGFFETIAQGKLNGHLLAAWVIDGKEAGTKALYSRDRGEYVPMAADDGFPAGTDREIRGLPAGKTGMLETDGSRVFLERISENRKLVICGAGHVSLSVIQIAVMLGFEVTAIEDRTEYADKAREAGAGHVVCSPFTEALDGIAGDDATAFVVMTREHAHDVDCLRRILGKEYAYAGMMGSRSRTEPGGLQNFSSPLSPHDSEDAGSN